MVEARDSTVSKQLLRWDLLWKPFARRGSPSHCQPSFNPWAFSVSIHDDNNPMNERNFSGDKSMARRLIMLAPLRPDLVP